jgi:hypothetical protein
MQVAAEAKTNYDEVGECCFLSFKGYFKCSVEIVLLRFWVNRGIAAMGPSLHMK